jgi:1A family penicillin-binding protein
MSPRKHGSAASSPRSSRRASDAAGTKRSIFWRWRRIFFAVGLIGVLLVAGAGYLFTQVPLPDRDPPLLQTTFMCASEVTSGCTADNSIAQLSGGVNRISVTWEEIPPVLVDAVLAAEDRNFFQHGGVDPAGIVRALWADVRSQGSTQGGSTITQQYVKNVYLTQERTLTRKIKEAALAVKVERELSKQEILTRYLNTIYLGRGAYGVEAASRVYFGKNLDQLTLPEAAYLAGLIRSPETADAHLPDNDPKAASGRTTAIQRRNSVLKAMVETGAITQSEADTAVASDWSDVLVRSMQRSFGNVAHPEWGTEYFIEYVRHWLTTEGGFTDAQVYGGGLRVYTTLDMTDQGAAADAVTSTLDQPTDPASALVSIDDQGAVRAMIGGLDYNGTGKYSKVNLAVGADGGGGGRQAGSAFKAFTLSEAMNQGIPLSRTYDAPSRITIPRADAGHDWSVGNYADAGLGQLDITSATMHSSNTAYAQIMMDVGPQNVADLATAMGITSPLKAVPALTLGTSEVSVIDMASAYSTLADNGEHIKPTVVTKVTDPKGKVLYENKASQKRVLDEKTTAKVDYVLNQVVEGGTATGARISQPAAGKTGTTENYRDAWFVGFTCKLTTAVWVGYPDGTFMKSVHGQSVTGGSFPATIWRKYMSVATKGLTSCPFPAPGYEADTSGTAVSNASTSTSSTSSTTSTSSSSTTTSTTAASTTTSTTAASTTTSTAIPAPKP